MCSAKRAQERTLPAIFLPARYSIRVLPNTSIERCELLNADQSCTFKSPIDWSNSDELLVVMGRSRWIGILEADRMRMQRIFSALSTLALVAACSGSQTDSKVEAGQGGANIGTGGGTNIGTGESTGSGASNGISDAGVIQPDAACAQSSSTASLGSLTMLVMM